MPRRPGVSRSLGVWFGVLALLVQLVVASLPLPSAAATLAGGDLVRICTTHHATPADKPLPQIPHHHGQCPLCAAVGLGDSLLPPPVGHFIAITRHDIALPVSWPDVPPPHGDHYTPQQPRGPPAFC